MPAPPHMSHLVFDALFWQLASSAVQAANTAQGASIYKSAGGALSSLINQFVDDSYRVGKLPVGAGAAPSPSLSAAGCEQPSRGGVAAFASVLGRGKSSLRVVGLGRTGMGEQDAVRLANALRRRPPGGPLSHVDVSGGRELARDNCNEPHVVCCVEVSTLPPGAFTHNEARLDDKTRVSRGVRANESGQTLWRT